MRFFILVFLLTATDILMAQDFRVKMKNGSLVESKSFILQESLFSNKIRILTDSGTFRLDSVLAIENRFATFEVLKFRRRMTVLARVLEKGKISLYDVADPSQQRERYYKRIRSNRLYYSFSGDSVLKAFRKKNFSKIFNLSFITQYPYFSTIRKNYARLNTMSLVSLIMLSVGELAIGSLQSGVALGIYTGVAIGGIIYILASRAKTLNKVREMVVAYNILIKNNTTSKVLQ